MSNDHSLNRYVGESSVDSSFEELRVSVGRNVSHKFRKKSCKEGGEEGKIVRGVSSSGTGGCLGFHGRSGGCKVGVEMCEEFEDGCGRRKSIAAAEEGKRYQLICGSEEVSVDCFSHGAERFWRRNCRKDKQVQEQCVSVSDRMEFFLPDEILEMCLVRLPLRALMTAPLVCKKWRSLTATDRFLQIRREYQKPWLFLFGIVKDGFCSGQIHVCDTSLDQWYKINANVLKGRFEFSVATVGDEIYVVGGCTSLSRFGSRNKSSFKTHKGVLVFNPLSKSWRKVAPMKLARSSPILGVFEVSSGSTISHGQNDRRGHRFNRTRLGGTSDVYEDPHRLSLRREHRDAVDGIEAAIGHRRNQFKFVKQERTLYSPNGGGKFGLIVVGGKGSWDERLDSGEMYDPVSNKWIDIGSLPADLGFARSGTVCQGLFYVYSDTYKLAAYDIERSRWVRIQLTQFPSLYDNPSDLISCNGRLLMLSVSFCEREIAVRKLFELDPMRFTWNEISRHPDAPMDWYASFVEDRGLIFGVEMFQMFGQLLDFFTFCDTSSFRLEWSRISRKREAHELDTDSCLTKSLAVLHM